MDEATNEMFNKSDDEEDIYGSAKATPHRHDHESSTSKYAADSEQE